MWNIFVLCVVCWLVEWVNKLVCCLMFTCNTANTTHHNENWTKMMLQLRLKRNIELNIGSRVLGEQFLRSRAQGSHNVFLHFQKLRWECEARA